MNMINSCILEGNVAKVEVKETVKGSKVADFSIACERQYKNDYGKYEKEISYFDCECFGQLAKFAETNLKKGRGVRVVGRMKQVRYQIDGKSASKVILVVEHLEVKPMPKSEENEKEQ